MKSVGKTVIAAYHGKAMVILRPFTKPGTISLKVESDGLTQSIIEIQVN